MLTPMFLCRRREMYCFQNTFIKLYQKPTNFTSKEHIKAWLIQVAIHVHAINGDDVYGFDYEGVATDLIGTDVP